MSSSCDIRIKWDSLCQWQESRSCKLFFASVWKPVAPLLPERGRGLQTWDTSKLGGQEITCVNEESWVLSDLLFHTVTIPQDSSYIF